MAHQPQTFATPGRVMMGVVVALALFAGAAHAAPWIELAPAPLASDSVFALLSARDLDSLSTDEYAWVEVQRDWRAQRVEEERVTARGIASYRQVHKARPADGRFARLASQMLADLSPSERAWLISENEAQREAREGVGHSQTGTIIGVGLLAVIAGGLLGACIVGAAIDDSLGHLFGN